MLKRLKDLLITLILWGYFTVGFCIFFGPFFLLALIASKNRQNTFQALNNIYFKSFFGLCRILMPKQQWRIDPRIQHIRGAVILCNHISYLDSILMVSLFSKHTTIAKASLFNIPVFGQYLDISGYIPSSAEGRFAEKQQRRLEQLPGFLKEGGNLFMFPEGTRSRDGKINPFQKGGFKISRMCQATIQVVAIRNTHHLFEPGRFLFHTGRTNTMEVNLVATLNPNYSHADFSIHALMHQVREYMGNNTTRSTQ